jgi:hypothetical protein
MGNATEVYRRDNCRLCESRELQVAVPLAPSAIADAYLPPGKAASSQSRYPLDLYLCNSCGHVQLLDVVNPELLFGDYTYRTSSSLGLVEHFRSFCSSIHALVRPQRNALAVEIGSNDGTLLRFFQDKGMRTLGIDPATTIANEATASGIETLAQFFTSTLAAEIVGGHGKASIVAANNVFAHADALGDIAAGVQKLLTTDGLFVFEVSYLVDIVDRLLFDTVYHEHLCYHSAKPLVGFLARHGLQLIEVQRLPIKGGSIRCIAQLTDGPRPVGASVRELLALEETKEIHKLATFERFASTIDSAKVAVHRKLAKLHSRGKRTAGFGASATVTTLLHHFDLGEHLEFLVDDNQSKWGLLSPGHHLEVRSPQFLTTDNIDCTVVLAWAYAKAIMNNHRDYQAQGGQFLVPLPSLALH